MIDSEIVTVTYPDMFRLMADLRGMGETNLTTNRNRKPLRRNVLMEAARIYHEKHAEPDGRIPATFEMIFLIGWAPHESQQKPLMPGSAKQRLADALNTKEVSSGIPAMPDNKTS